MSLFQNSNGDLIEDENGKLACECCPGTDSQSVYITYDWSGTGGKDLDTATVAFGESAGFGCYGGGSYVSWYGDDTSYNGSEGADVNVGAARDAGLWTTSYTIDCYACWYANPGTSPTIHVTYKGDEKSATISAVPTECNGCQTWQSASIVVYHDALSDGTYFEIETVQNVVSIPVYDGPQKLVFETVMDNDGMDDDISLFNQTSGYWIHDNPQRADAYSPFGNVTFTLDGGSLGDYGDVIEVYLVNVAGVRRKFDSWRITLTWPDGKTTTKNGGFYLNTNDGLAPNSPEGQAYIDANPHYYDMDTFTLDRNDT